MCGRSHIRAKYGTLLPRCRLVAYVETRQLLRGLTAVVITIAQHGRLFRDAMVTPGW